MDSMYGGDEPPGPSEVYEGTREEGGERGDADYYQVTRGQEYGHHYTAASGQYEVLSRAIVNPDGSMQDAPQSYYALEPHRPIPIHPSTGLPVLPTTPLNTPGGTMNGTAKREDSVRSDESGRRTNRSSRSKSSSFDPDRSSDRMSERETSIKKKKASQARARYHRMNEEERKAFNLRRRLKQKGLDMSGHGEPAPPTRKQLDRIEKANRRKAAAAKRKYQEMSEAERKEYNSRRTDAFRRKRREEEQLMMSPAMRISQDAYDKAQAIINRNSRKASAARERYARMSQEERKEYNQRRAELKKRREREQMERKMLMEAEGMEGMRHLCEASEVAREMEGYEESLGYTKEEGTERREEDDEMEDVEVDDVDVTSPDDRPSPIQDMPDQASTSSSTLTLPLPPAPLPTETQLRGRTGGGRGGRRGPVGGVIKRREPAKTAHSIIRAVEEAHSNLNYDRSRSEYDESWSMHQGSSLGGVLIEDGSRVVYADERSGHIEVGEELHHLQTRPASAGVYEYAEHSMDDHFGPEMVQHEVEVPHSPHHQLHHDMHHMEGEIDVVHADDDDMREEWDSDAHLINSISERPYHPREKTQQLQMLIQHGEGGEAAIHSARIVEQRARRALRSRLRYANMSSEQKARHNAERAKQLRESRRRDMQLLQMADNDDVMLDGEMRKMVEAAQERRNRRAEQARHKYRRMSEEERRAYNAMRDAQRRSRRRDLEGLSDGEDEMERSGHEEEEIRRVRGGGRSSSVSGSVSSMGGRGGGGGPPSTVSTGGATDHHLHLQRGAATSGHYTYEMYEQEWTGHH